MKCECVPGNYLCKRAQELWFAVKVAYDAYSDSGGENLGGERKLKLEYLQALDKYDEHIKENKRCSKED